MLLRAQTSTLLIIDIQERLFPAIHEAESVLEHSAWLLAVAQRLGVPALATEQYPKGLGPTLPALRDALPAEALLEKIAFSAVADPGLLQMPGGERRQFVVCGTEAHVCVLQTVLGLLADDREVFVVDEAVGSRHPRDKALALERMRQAGAMIVSREMVAFEWMERAGTEVFREISKQFIR
ncbi:isochorismatase family hydrolase [Pseudomonas sp. ATCC 13867]|uniref:hydrolase n=1 Tax=Pseudomonas sp. ATCC 13867 TaxID=1294143 RepID=UPI0002C4F53F|nr:hydrolase [Pseudomonas sp. ATCC 13867]AGI25685.1 isochorismatase family hydrolase [Pseudomonas sp. ATCC 13867]RFQ34973.1 hydrolase [Pseudomonas sp. ATCC 13867]